MHQYYCPPDGWGNDRSRVISDYWQKAGAAIEVITTTAYFPDKHPLKSTKEPKVLESKSGVLVHVLPVAYQQSMSFRRRLKAFMQFYRLAKTYTKRLGKPDIVYASSTPLSVARLGHQLSKRWDVPWVFEAVDVWPDVPIGMGIVKNPLLKANLHRQTKQLYAAAAQIIALSPGMCAQILSHGVDPEKVIVSFNGTDPKAFQPIPHENGLVKFVYAGALGKANDVQRLVEHWRLMTDLDAAFKQAELTIYGFGAFEAEVQQLVKRYASVGVNLIFAGHLPKQELAKVLGQYDVGICWFAPHEVLEANSANKFYDYLAAGLPVLNNYDGWQTDLIEAKNCGLGGRIQYGTKFQDNARRLIQEPLLRKSMSVNARELAVQQFDRQMIAADLLQRLQQLTSRATD